MPERHPHSPMMLSGFWGGDKYNRKKGIEALRRAAQAEASGETWHCRCGARNIPPSFLFCPKIGSNGCNRSRKEVSISTNIAIRTDRKFRITREQRYG